MRLRCSYNTAGTETFRFSSSKDAFGKGLNLQNVPKGGSSDIAFYCKVNGPTRADILAKELFKSDLAKCWAKIDSDLESGAVTVQGSGDSAIVHYRLLLPNVRKMFIPDTGYIIEDWDLDRADLQVVVWEADDADLKAKLRTPKLDLHSENAKELGLTRQQAKTWVHLTNYGGPARTAAEKTGLTVHRSEVARTRWFSAHPGILAWHRRTEEALRRTRTVYNKFGYRRFYFDRVEEILPEVLAWVPQSTVALVINQGLVNISRHLPHVQILLQVHDSLVIQIPESCFPSEHDSIRRELSITIPYPDPLIIPTSGKFSRISWGDVKDIN